jgi:hypothetical protein
MKHFLKKIFGIILISTLLITTQNYAQDDSSKKILVENEQHYVFYYIKNQNLVMTIELIDDFTDDTRGDVFPNMDYASILVDKDQDAKITPYIDGGYSLKGKPTWIKRDWEKYPFETELCINFMISYTTSTGCGKFNSESSLDFGFRASSKQPKKHPIYKFTIPLKELSDGDKDSARIRLKIFSAGKSFIFYPTRENESNNLFAKTLEIKF